jgi:hypothetical protein
MVGLGNFFDRPVVESQPEYSVLPAGNYEAVLVDSRMKQSKAGKDYLSLEFKIRSGEYSNRSVWGRYMINDTGAAGQIARNQLQALETATGVVKPADSSEWHDIPVTIAVKVVPSKGEYGPSNEITNFIRLQRPQAAPATASHDDNSPW